jgi:flagellar biogenesis protein FliO
MKFQWFSREGKKNNSLLLPLLFIAALGIAVYMLGSFGTPAAASQPAASPTATAAATSAPGTQDTGYLAGQYSDATTQPQAQQAQPNNWFGDIVDVLIKLVVVLGVLYLCLRGLRYLNNKSRAATSAGSPVKVLYSTSLAQHQNLYLVELGDKVLLLGGTSNQIGLLSEIADKDLIAALHSSAASPSQPSSFATYLDRFLKSAKADEQSVPSLQFEGGLTVAQAIESCKLGLDKARSDVQHAAARF